MHQKIRIASQKDLNRQVIKSEWATVRFEELDFEIPPTTQSGILSTVDGLINRAVEGLSQDQEKRKEQHPELAVQIEGVITVLNGYFDGKPFTLVLDDPSGNSYIENLSAPNPDPKIVTTYYKRSKKQAEELGLQAEDEELPLNEQVHTFNGPCSRCSAPCETKMHMLGLKFFHVRYSVF